MKLTALRRTDAQAFAPIEAVFDAPGGTIGRSPENHLALAAAPGAICRVQAVLRVSETDCRLLNLSNMGPVSINGQPLARDQEAAVRHGDEVAIGAYVLRAEDDKAVAAAPVQVEPQAEPQAQAEEPAPDVFGDLFGPGTLPVGGLPDGSTHPFDMRSAAARNPEDPLAQLSRDSARLDTAPRDPLHMFGGPDADSVEHVFSDPTPTTLPSRGPLAAYREDPIGDTLGRAAQREDGIVPSSRPSSSR
jgi:FHA domain-containing protein